MLRKCSTTELTPSLYLTYTFWVMEPSSGNLPNTAAPSAQRPGILTFTLLMPSLVQVPTCLCQAFGQDLPGYTNLQKGEEMAQVCSNVLNTCELISDKSVPENAIADVP